jgi:thiamine kinase-like enzyme
LSNEIITTGGVFYKEDHNLVTRNICDVFSCKPNDINNIRPIQAGLTNIVLTFHFNGGQYVYRHPGLGANDLINRGREAIVQKQVEEIDVDTTLIAMSVKHGWRISRFVESRGFDYHNLSDVVRGITLLKRLHDSPAKVRWEFDIFDEIKSIKTMIPEDTFGVNFKEFALFGDIEDRVNRLNDMISYEQNTKCLTHGDCRDVNFLINENEIHLIDWEYSGYSDAGFDIGTYICGGNHSEDDVDRILFIYFGRSPTVIEKRHFYAYIAIAGFFYMHWTMYKESLGQKIGYLKPLWYHYANEYSHKALQLKK